MQLNQLPLHTIAKIAKIQANSANDPISTRLINLGFTQDEPVHIIAQLGKKTGSMIVKLGNTKFALRHAEAQRIYVSL